jgi:hypothetical protein
MFVYNSPNLVQARIAAMPSTDLWVEQRNDLARLQPALKQSCCDAINTTAEFRVGDTCSVSVSECCVRCARLADALEGLSQIHAAAQRKVHRRSDAEAAVEMQHLAIVVVVLQNEAHRVGNF